MWVLIVLFMGAGNPSIAMHDFADQQACEAAVSRLNGMAVELRGVPQIKASCVPKASPK